MSSVRPLPLPPLRTDREANVNGIVNGMLAHVRARDMQEALQLAREDRGATAMLQRSYKLRTAQTPHNLDNLTTFSHATVDTTVDILGLDHIIGALFSRAGVKVTLGHGTSVFVPGTSYDGSNVSFVKPGNMFRIGSWDTSQGCIVKAGMKLSYGIVVTRELVEDSNAGPILRRKLVEDVGGALEATVLSDADAVEGVQPAGLLKSGQTVTASDLSNPGDALIADVGGLAAKLSGIGGEILWIANLAEATRIQARLPFFKNVFASAAIAEGNLVAIAPRGLAVAGSDQGPLIDVSDEATVVLDNALTDEQVVSNEGTVSWPLRSLFQSDTQLIRLQLPDLCWAQRAACVAMLTGSIAW